MSFLLIDFLHFSEDQEKNCNEYLTNTMLVALN